MKEELLKEIVMRYKEDVLPPFHDILDVLGFDALCYLADEFGGSQLYIPTQKRLFGHCVSRQVLKDFTGGNYRELSKKYDMSDRGMRGLLERERKRSRQTN